MDIELQWSPCNFTAGLTTPVEDIDRNIESTLAREYIGLLNIVSTESGAVSIVGSGPSLKDNWKKLRDSNTDIIACNASCQFLLERGIVPKYMFCFDADPLIYEFFTPHPEITYLIASRCPPKTFELLKDCKVIVWHAGGDPNIEKLLSKYKKMEPMVAGGTMATTRAMMLAQPLGYTEIHLWGADGSFKNGDTHIRKSTTDEKRMVVMLNNKAFETAPWMCAGVSDFKLLAPILRDQYGIKLIVHGEGMIPHLAQTLGYKVDGKERIKYLLRETNRKARILWSQL